jgi:hypothetical protein
MPNTVSCERCGDDVAESETVYADDGSLLCGPCDERDAIQEAERTEERATKTDGGLIDQIFLKDLNKTGRIAYWIGQIAAGIVLVIGYSGTLGFERIVARYELPFLCAILVFVFGWGSICTLIWPIDRGPDAPDYDEFDV